MSKRTQGGRSGALAKTPPPLKRKSLGQIAQDMWLHMATWDEVARAVIREHKRREREKAKR